MYSKKVMDVFKNPENMGEIADADGLGKVGNPVCGDVMWVYIKVGHNSSGEEILEDVKVKTFGCVAAIVSSSVLTDIAIGKTLDEALKISKQDIAEGLELPKVKLHCSVLAADGLKRAIEDYRSRSA